MKKLSLVIALGLAAISAQAATVSFQFQFPAPALTNTEINQSGALGLFDTNLGTLTDVELVLNSAMAGAITLSLGQSTTNRNISGTSTSDIFFTSSLAPLNAFLGAVSQNLSFTTGFINLAPGDSQTTSGLTDAESTALNAALALSSPASAHPVVVASTWVAPRFRALHLAEVVASQVVPKPVRPVAAR